MSIIVPIYRPYICAVLNLIDMGLILGKQEHRGPLRVVPASEDISSASHLEMTFKLVLK